MLYLSTGKEGDCTKHGDFFSRFDFCNFNTVCILQHLEVFIPLQFTLRFIWAGIRGKRVPELFSWNGPLVIMVQVLGIFCRERNWPSLMSSNWSASYFPQHSSFATWRLRLFPTWNEKPLMGRIIVLWRGTSPTPTLGRDDFSCRSPKQVAVICFDTSNMYQAFAFYRTRVRSLAMLVTNSLTDSLCNV